MMTPYSDFIQHFFSIIPEIHTFFFFLGWVIIYGLCSIYCILDSREYSL